MSKRKWPDQNPVEAVETEAVAEVVESKVEEVATPTEEAAPVVLGTVTGCQQLNVRKKPNVKAHVLCVIARSTAIEIDESKSTAEFYKVRLSDGTEGFCMKRFVTIKL